MKDTTLNDLEGMVAKGFDGVDKRFDDVDKRFNEVNDRFDRIENLLHNEYRQRIEKLEDQVSELQKDYRQLVGFK